MKRILISAFLLTIFLSFSINAKETKLLRFPAIHGDDVVFVYAGDIYIVNKNGGIARQLTDHVGIEVFPKFSHDGKHIAFTGQYDGNTEVYIMPSEGGIPKRITFTATLGRDDITDRMGPNNIVMDWTPDDKNVLYRSRQIEFNDFKGQLFLAGIEGDVSSQVALPRGGFANYNDDGSKLAYNRVFREFRTWKKYRGGMADDVWVYDFKTKETTNITNNPAQDIIPMWKGNLIYFLSDRDENKRMNLYSYNFNTKATDKLTDFKDFDIKFPSLGDNAIIFENGGEIYFYDLTQKKTNKISVTILNDFTDSRPKLVDVSKSISNYEISSDGKRALFGARGEVFTVPASKGFARNLTESSGAHERDSKWSPDGKFIAYISDASGNDEIYIIAQDGKSKPVQLTDEKGAYKNFLEWSPDSKKILYADRELNLKYVEIDSKKITIVDKADYGRGLRGTWSPDSKWIAFTKADYQSVSVVYLHELESDKIFPVTDNWYESAQPVFSSDGKYLFFISMRDFNPIYSWTEWNHAYNDMAGIYFVTLSKETKNPFEPVNDEVKVEEEKKSDDKKDEKKNDEKKEEKKSIVKIDTDGLNQRIVKIPIDASNYFNVTALENKIYYMRRGNKDEKPLIFMYDLEKQKETELGQINGYEISFDKKKIIVSKNGNYAILDLPSSKIEIKETLNISELKVTVDKKAEWNQVFNQAWRQMRDFFYVKNMHGLDWEAVRKSYEPWLEHVNNRMDLGYVMGEMLGELNIGHAYVGGGDFDKPERIKLGLLGAKVERDKDSRFYKITKILDGNNWNKSLRSPLKEIGVDVKEGDFIIAVDGKFTNVMNNIFEALIDKANKQVTISVNSKATKEGAKDYIIVPIDDEAQLYYFNWVHSNIEKVNKATNGKIGYLHIPDMGAAGLNEFVKYFYPQLQKEGLIIDVRGNGGGNVSPMIIERLRREIAMVDHVRNNKPVPDPGDMLLGPKVTLVDEFSASDGDLFPYRFKHYSMGKLIGKRSWGGVVGIYGSNPYVDGTVVNTPESGPFSLDGKNWVIEGYGVDPDIIVDNDPAKEFEGIDEQLNKAIEVILQELKDYKFKLPNKPDDPVRK